MGTSVAVKQSERPPWRWRDWYSQWVTRGEFPDEFGEALMGLCNSIRRFYPDEQYGPWDEDRIQELLGRVVNAIVHGEDLRKHYRAGWSNEQFYGYFRTIMENEIRRMRKEQFPMWFWMVERIVSTEGQTLAVIDELKKLYVPMAWIASKKCWEDMNDEALDDLLSGVQPLKIKVPERVPRSLIDEILGNLFSATSSPIPLNKLVAHALRILHISDLHLEPLEAWVGEGQWMSPDIADPKATDCCVEVDVERWLPRALALLTVEHLLVVKFYGCDGITFEETAQRVSNLLGLRRFGPETARNRYLDATRLMRSAPSAKCKYGFFPADENEERIFCNLLSDCVVERLARMGIPLGVSEGR